MNHLKKTYIFLLLLAIGGLFMIKEKSFSTKHSEKLFRTILLGASVGKEWNLPDWPERMHNNKYGFEMIPVYAFDKSQVLEEILMRPRRKFHFNKSYIKGFFSPAPQKPDAIIIKECAAYFPGDFTKYKILIQQWISQYKTAGIQIILTTVVPVTRDHAQKRPGRLEEIIAYNNWIKEYARNAGLNCIDLEAYLRISDNDRALSPDLTNGDGLHLNSKAYKILDRKLLDNLETLFNQAS